MRKQALSILVENTSGVLSHISGLFSRRGYNIDSFSSGVTADPRYTRITIVASGDEQILEQIEKQLAKLEEKNTPKRTTRDLVFDDEDEELANTSIEEWMTYEGDDFYENVERILSSLLCNMKNEGKFDKLTILKPFSFVLVDDDRETIAELLLMDDDTLLVNEELLKGLDEELDSFLKELLEK